MTRTVQICPIGFEFDRVIEGVKEHSCNIIYLLKSIKKTVNKDDPNKLLLKIANSFVSKLEKHFLETKICEPIVRETNVVTLEKTVEELCLIIKEEIEIHGTKEIWINISTSTKLFVSAAMCVGAYYPKIVHLFYLDARHYTANLLLNDSMTKKEIAQKFKDYGITYKESEKSYKGIAVPSYTTDALKDLKKDVIVTLKKMIDATGQEMVTFINLLRELGKEPSDKKIKVRYGHHISYLKSHNWVYEKKHGQQRKYGLTPEGRILSIIHTHLKEEDQLI